MSIVSGRDVLLKINNGTTYEIVGCNASCELEITTDTYETTFVGDGSTRGFIPNKTSMVLTGSGPISFDTGFSPADLVAFQIARRAVSWTFELTDNTTTVVYSGGGYIVRSVTTGAVGGGPATCDYTIQVTGPLVISNATGGTVTVQDAYYTATGGETSISFTDAIGGTCIEIERDGVGTEVLTVGTPTNGQSKFTSGTGGVDFPSAIPLALNEVVHIIFIN